MGWPVCRSTHARSPDCSDRSASSNEPEGNAEPPRMVMTRGWPSETAASTAMRSIDNPGFVDPDLVNGVVSFPSSRLPNGRKNLGQASLVISDFSYRRQRPGSHPSTAVFPPISDNDVFVRNVVARSRPLLARRTLQFDDRAGCNRSSAMFSIQSPSFGESRAARYNLLPIRDLIAMNAMRVSGNALDDRVRFAAATVKSIEIELGIVDLWHGVSSRRNHDTEVAIQGNSLSRSSVWRAGALSKKLPS